MKRMIITPPTHTQNHTCDTHEATMALRALLCAAVTTYSPLDSRAMALAISAGIAAFFAAIASLAVRAWAKSVPCREKEGKGR